MIPILDWTDYETDPDAFTSALGAACRDTGFFLLSGHPVPDQLVSDVFTAADTFFSLPPSEKAPLSITKNPHNRGWSAQGSENLDDTSDQVDQKEAYNVGLDLAEDDPRVVAGEPFRGVNVWPDLPGFRDTMLTYYDAALALGVALQQPIATDLGLPKDFFAQHFDQSLATLRVLTYPAATGAEGEIGAGAHTDYGSVTLLMTDGEPGLQVKPRGGDWTDVPHVPGAFVVNIGDLLMRWSNDIYVSTPHRVLPPKRRRRSIAFFLDPNPDSVIRAIPGSGEAKYPPVTGADYLRYRLDATYKPEPVE
ncbi:isopenicillin N synthase family oxygenase [Pseudoruegeria sp. HB172150]|uniref:isopenicillin N synthase family dioxygenase n=1 Tax=Pseudoruegeria sp. HB172150 TaxID=2721164 RepID=UPI0015523D9D|nr:isopenicillin N synthase family oxygenase [Pseudoruegeria sp. HB172150]